MAIFNSYVSLPEGSDVYPMNPMKMCYVWRAVWLGHLRYVESDKAHVSH